MGSIQFIKDSRGSMLRNVVSVLLGCVCLFSQLSSTRINLEGLNLLSPDGFSKITVPEAERAIAGNLCRCTGYRPIADACKSFAADVDSEDLGFNAFWKKGEKDGNMKRLPFYRGNGICTFPDFLKSEINSAMASCSHSLQEDQIDLDMPNLDISNNSVGMTLAENNRYRPNSIDDLYKMLNSNDLTKSSIKMVVGIIGSGVYKEQDLYDTYIDLRGIPELSGIKLDSKGIKTGAAVTISKTIEILKEEHEGLLPPSMRLVFTKLADHRNKVASQFVWNTASLGGNLVMAQRNQLPSDIATILLAVGSSFCIQMPSERLILTLEEFLRRSPRDQGTLLLSIYIPCWNSSLNNNNNIDYGAVGQPVLLFETYRAATRPLGNAVAYLNAAFLAQISLHKLSGDLVLDDLCLAFGAYDNKHAIRARKVENFLVGKSVTASVLLEAIRLLRETIVPIEGTTHSDYRSSLAVAFLFKFLQPLLRGLTELGKDASLDISNAVVPAESLGGCSNGHRDALPMKESKFKDLYQPDNNDLFLSSKQLVGYSRQYHPVGEPTKKVGAEIQASGEVIYVDDIPSPKDCLYGAFFYSRKARIKSLDIRPALASKKIITVISTNAIPKGGTNIGSASIFGSEPLFADSLAECAGQPLGMVIAETQRFADMGAKQVAINYSTENLEPPILSVEEAVRRSSFFEVPAFFYPKQIGDFSKGIKEADQKIMSEEHLHTLYGSD